MVGRGEEQAMKEDTDSNCSGGDTGCTPLHRRVIAGVQVTYPFKPYGSQVAIASKLIQALNRKENALLESPTGSGKTLAILCASLAWQEKEHARLMEVHEKEERGKLTSQKVGKVVPTLTCVVLLYCIVMFTVLRMVLYAYSGSFCTQNPKSKPPRAPQIFVASRTHSQITQIVR